MANTPGIIPNQRGVYGMPSGLDDPESQPYQGNNQLGMFGVGLGQGHASQLRTFRKSFTPGGPLKVLFCGDSITEALGTGGITTPFPQVYQRIMRNMHQFGDGGIGLVPVYWDAAPGSGVTHGGTPVLAGQGFGIASTARFVSTVDSYTFDTSAMTFTLGTKAVQSLDILYIDQGAFIGDIRYKIDGGAVQTLVTAKLGDNNVKAVNIPAGAAPGGFAGNTTHSVQILGSSAVALVGVIIYAATTGASGIQCYNAGIGGTTAEVYSQSSVDNASSCLSFIDVIQPHLTFVHLGANDSYAPNERDYIKFFGGLNALLFKLAFVGSDIVLIAPPDINPNFFATFPMNIDLRSIEKGIQELAVLYNLPMLNLRVTWGNFGTYNASGLCGDSLVHPNQTGQDDIANRIYKLQQVA